MSRYGILKAASKARQAARKEALERIGIWRKQRDEDMRLHMIERDFENPNVYRIDTEAYKSYVAVRIRGAVQQEDLSVA